MKSFVASLVVGALGFAIVCIGISSAVTKRDHALDAWLFGLLAGAFLVSLSLLLLKIFRRKAHDVGAFALSSVVIAVCAFTILGLLTGQVIDDFLAWAAVSCCGLAAGLSGAAGARLVSRTCNTRLDWFSLVIALGGTALILLLALLFPARISQGRNVKAITSAAECSAEIGDGNGWVILEFGATWCGPCRKLAPNLDKVAGQLVGEAKFLSVDVDVLPEVAADFKVSSLPAIIVCRDGDVVGCRIGYQETEDLETFLSDLGLRFRD